MSTMSVGQGDGGRCAALAGALGAAAPLATRAALGTAEALVVAAGAVGALVCVDAVAFGAGSVEQPSAVAATRAARGAPRRSALTPFRW
jgi:hypothetical protein